MPIQSKRYSFNSRTLFACNLRTIHSLFHLANYGSANGFECKTKNTNLFSSIFLLFSQY